MNSNELLDLIGEAREEYVFAAKQPQARRTVRRPLLIAAVIILILALVGCTVAVLALQDLKIGKFTYSEEYWDENGNLATEIITKDVLSLQGIRNSPNQLAAQEWHEFYQDYDVDGELIGEAEAAGYAAPRAYDAYFVYDQTMQDKVDEIALKYGLKLAGREAVVQSYQSELLFDAIGIDDLHHADMDISVEYGSGYFFECGNFDLDFQVMLSDKISDWPYEILTSMRYCNKEYLDTVYLTIDSETVQQWNYTTADGTEILIVMGEDFARYFCDREDAFVTVSLNTYYRNDFGENVYMGEKDVELLANYIDFNIVPQKPDMDAAMKALQQSEQDQKEAMGKTEYFSYDDFILERIEALGDRADELYYHLIDLTDDGEEELILGSKDKIDIVWTMIDGQMNMIMSWGENYKKLEEVWPNMEKKPITEYSEQSADQEEDGYDEYMLDALATAKHPENIFYALKDVDGNGVVDLLYGSKEILDWVWTVEYDKNGYPCIKLLSFSFTEEEWNTWNTAWASMEKKPITEYFAE